jgi:hypothetical protein
MYLWFRRYHCVQKVKFESGNLILTFVTKSLFILQKSKKRITFSVPSFLTPPPSINHRIAPMFFSGPGALSPGTLRYPPEERPITSRERRSNVSWSDWAPGPEIVSRSGSISYQIADEIAETDGPPTQLIPCGPASAEKTVPRLPSPRSQPLFALEKCSPDFCTPVYLNPQLLNSIDLIMFIYMTHLNTMYSLTKYIRQAESPSRFLSNIYVSLT